MNPKNLIFVFCSLSCLLVLMGKVSCGNNGTSKTCQDTPQVVRPGKPVYVNSSILFNPNFFIPPIRFIVKNSTAVLVFMDHGWTIPLDRKFYKDRFVLLTKRIFAGGKYANLILSPNYIGRSPYRSVSEIFLKTMSHVNLNRSKNHQSTIKVWLHLRSKAQFQLYDEKLVLPFLSNPAYSKTLTGLLVEAGTLDPRREWHWTGMQHYRKAVQAIRKRTRVKLALLVDRYSCSYLPMHVPQEIFNIFDYAFYYDYEKPELEAAMFQIQHSKNVVDQKRVTMRRDMFDDCKRWFTAVVPGKKVKPIRGVFHGVENKQFFNFTEIQLYM